jgi:hypothetical protein
MATARRGGINNKGDKMEKIVLALVIMLTISAAGYAQDTCCDDAAACEILLNEALDNQGDQERMITDLQDELAECLMRPSPDEQLNPINQLLQNMQWFTNLPKPARIGISGLLLLGLTVGTAYIQTQ